MAEKKLEVTEEQEVLESKLLKNTLYVRLTQQTFRMLYKVAKENGTTMSEVARLCIESRLIEAGNLLKEIRELKSDFSKG